MKIKTVGLREAKELVRLYVNSGIVPHLSGPPGSGKSAIIKELAREKNLFLIDLRASTLTPSDVGVPDKIVFNEGKPNEEARIRFIIPEDFPLDTDALPINPETNLPYAGFMLFLDEFLSAPEEVQAVFYKVMLDRQIGNRNLHPKTVIVGASNREEDGGLVNTMLTPMRTRLGHINIRSNVETWTEDFAAPNKVHPAIIAYVLRNPKKLNKLEVEDSQTFPCERTWDMASRFLKHTESLNIDLQSKTNVAGLCGLIGTSTATELLAFTRYFSELPDIESVYANPKSTEVPKTDDYQFAMLTQLAHCYPSVQDVKETAGLTEDIASLRRSAIMAYLKQFALDKQLIAVKLIMGRLPHTEVTNHPDLDRWVMDNPHIFTL